MYYLEAFVVVNCGLWNCLLTTTLTDSVLCSLYCDSCICCQVAMVVLAWLLFFILLH